MWVESVVDSLHRSETLFSRCSGFPLTSKTNISKFQFDQEQQTKNHFEDELPIKHHFYIFYLKGYSGYRYSVEGLVIVKFLTDRLFIWFCDEPEWLSDFTECDVLSKRGKKTERQKR